MITNNLSDVPLVKNVTTAERKKRPWYADPSAGGSDVASSASKTTRVTFEATDSTIPNGTDIQVGESRVLALEQEVRMMRHEMIEMKRVLDSRNLATNMALARDREELDYLANRNKEHRILITGISCDTEPPEERTAKGVWIRQVVTKLLGMLKPGIQKSIKGIWQKPPLGGRPAAEVVMESSELAMEIRINFAKKKKQGIDFGDIFLQNVVTIATKVRVAVMQAIVDKFKTEDLLMNVRNFTSRPTLLIKKKQGEEVEEIGLTYVDAMKRFGRDLKAEDLDLAYSRAGNSFNGQMAQTFVVMHESFTDAKVNAARIRSLKRKEAAAAAAVAAAAVSVAAAVEAEVKKREETVSGSGRKFKSGFGSGAKPRKKE